MDNSQSVYLLFTDPIRAFDGGPIIGYAAVGGYKDENKALTEMDKLNKANGGFSAVATYHPLDGITLHAPAHVKGTPFGQRVKHPSTRTAVISTLGKFGYIFAKAA